MFWKKKKKKEKEFPLILANGRTTAYHLANRQVPSAKPVPPHSVSYMKFMMNWSTQRQDFELSAILLETQGGW